MSTVIAERPRPARPGEMRCTATSDRVAQDTRARFEQRCVLPIAHEGGHFWDWFEIGVDE